MHCFLEEEGSTDVLLRFLGSALHFWMSFIANMAEALEQYTLTLVILRLKESDSDMLGVTRDDTSRRI